MTDHRLGSSPETCHWGFFDASLPPVLTIRSGDRVTIESISGGRDVLPPPGFTVLPDHQAVIEAMVPRMRGHLLTGPVAVEGALPGDVLEIRIESVECRQDWAWTRIHPTMGSLPADFPFGKTWHTRLDRERGVAILPWGTELPLTPFFGVMGVAPPAAFGAVSTIEPRAYGGNMDLKELVPGTVLYLPVFAPGALFSVGDGHGAQGDGEVCLTALETALEGRFQIILRKDLKLPLPRAETPTHWITMGFDPDLDDAATTALREMIDLIANATGLAREDAYMLTSVACDLRVTQMVDGNKGIHAMLAKSLLVRR
ncbi:MAG TPA: acetamidase/formamidase family protein [Aliidongia sp.]|uniref:acetamidase/formamidase family protein n=1 Tax=Aliidongia sp. TaxID=1914230 RepID=UPI002DDCEC0B|nr:acetamidase/formamidase family protein [Aliidongia sp.]HEV2675076.1 acetamidase/formamidase family protein [Aliidongia sp.]